MTDHVFRTEADGQLTFIGDFDGLYRAEADPWQQEGQSGPLAAYYEASRARLAAKLSRAYGAGCVGLEVGCGHGHVTAYLAEHVGGRWTGADISGVAINQARLKHRGVSFYPVDITKQPFPFLGSERTRYDVVILSQLLWYVMGEMDAVFENAAALLRPGGLLVISQAFLRDQRYGREIIDGFEGAAALRRPGLRLIHAQLDDTGEHVHDDGLIIFRKLPNEG